jgi:hypothetical protein
MKDKQDADIIERMKSIPRYSPRALFRAKVALVTMLPSLGTALSERRAPRLGWGPRPSWSRPGRALAAAAMALLLAFIVFSSLMLTSSSSLPGEALYGLKRAREQLGLAFTWSQAAKAERNLNLAAARLAELDNLNQRGKLDSDSVKQLATDYAGETAAVTQILKQNPGTGESQLIAKRLQALQTQKANMVSRLMAASPAGVLAESEGAAVSVKDSAGTGALRPGGAVSGVTDDEGQFQFGVDVSNPAQLSGLDTYIEQDGRKAVIPVFDKVQQAGPYSIQVEPTVRVLKLDTPTMFTIKVTRSGGSAVAMKPVKLDDPSLTSSINGRKGEVLLWTDASGACSFTVTKTSADASSRIRLQVEDAGWTDAGEILRLGGLQAPAGAAADGTVSVKALGGNVNPQRIELDNGIVKVIAEKATSGEIVSSMARMGGSTTAGPLSDPLPAEARGLSKEVTVNGPRLLFARSDAAGYETVIEMPVSGGSVVKTYQVVLDSGNPYAIISCEVEASGPAAELVKTNPGLLDTCVLATPPGASFVAGGKKVSTMSGDTGNLLSFEIGNPFVAYSTNSEAVLLACPIDSATYPQAWSLTSTSLSPSMRDSSAVQDRGFTSKMLFGIAERDELDSVVCKARTGIGDPAQVSSATTPPESSNGFALVVRPSYEELRKGKHTVILKVFKQYQKVIQNF